MHPQSRLLTRGQVQLTCPPGGDHHRWDQPTNIGSPPSGPFPSDWAVEFSWNWGIHLEPTATIQANKTRETVALPHDNSHPLSWRFHVGGLPETTGLQKSVANCYSDLKTQVRAKGAACGTIQHTTHRTSGHQTTTTDWLLHKCPCRRQSSKNMGKS